MHLSRVCSLLSLLVVFAFIAVSAHARKFEVLFADSSGRNPHTGLTEANDGTFYGTTAFGGVNDCGTVFKVSEGGTLTTIYSFNRSTGRSPSGPLVLGANGDLYGTTWDRGLHGFGTIFKLTPEGVLTTLHNFNRANGENPHGLILATDGNLYGTTAGGGVSNHGTVFKITPQGGFSSLCSLNTSSGSKPRAGLVQGDDGHFYGTTTEAGANGTGTVFKVTSTGVLTAIHHLSATTRYVFAPLVKGKDGNFYGTTVYGGTSDNGTVFRVTPAGEFSTLQSFNYMNGANPASKLVVGTDGDLYGTASYGANNGDGTIFKITHDGVLTKLHAFNRTNGSHPEGALILGKDGHFYGTTTEGGASNYGTVFKITAEGVLTTLTSTGNTNSRNPDTGVVLANDGNFYGVSTNGGPNDYGTVFRLTPDGSYTLLHALRYSDGARPMGPLTAGVDGNLYGTAFEGGANDFGTIFRITPGGVLTRLHSFNSADGSRPIGGLTLGPDGNLYGATSGGGANGFGTIFKVTTEGALTTLHSFSSADGRSPFGSLVIGNDGALYGTTTSGGTNGYGTVFKISVQGALTRLHSFSSTDGRTPQGGLVLSTAGNLYGITYEGGAHNLGTIFKVTPDGVVSTVYAFDGTKGSLPRAGLVASDDGNLYGTTSGGGANTFGTLFELTSQGDVTTLHSFDGSSAGVPGGRPLFGSDGRLYGLAAQMAFWRFSLVSPPAITTTDATGITVWGAQLHGSVTANGGTTAVDFEYGTSPAYGSSAAATPSVVNGHIATPVAATLSGLQPHTTYYFRLRASNATGTSFSDEGSFITLNRPPVAGSATVRVREGETAVLTLPFALTDADGDAVSVENISTSRGAPFLFERLDANTVAVTGSVGAMGVGRVFFTVNDGFGGVAKGSVTVAVTGLTSLPVGELLVSEGEPVPDAPNGAVWSTFGVPCATQLGDVAFTAKMRAGTKSFTGILFKRAHEPLPSTIAIADNPVPEIEEATLTKFKDPIAIATPDGYRVLVFQATARGAGAKGATYDVICRYSDALGLELLARTGSGGTAVGEEGARIASFTSIGLSPNATLWATVTLQPKVGGVTKANNHALVMWAPDSKTARVVLRKRDLLTTNAGEKNVLTIGTLVPVQSSPGHGRWMAADGLAMRLGFADKSSGIYATNGAGEDLTEIALTGGPIALGDETAPTKWASFGFPTAGPEESATFLGNLKLGTGTVSRTNATGIFHGGTNGCELIARTGDQLADSSVFSQLNDPVSNAHGTIAFLAKTKHVGVKGTRTSVWVSRTGTTDSDGTTITAAAPQKVARTGDSAPDSGGAVFASFVSLALPDNESAAPVFVATLSGESISRSNNRGLWAAELNGALHMVLRTGSIIWGLESRGELKRFTVLDAVPGSPAQPRAFDSQGSVVCRVEFKDGSQALVNVVLP